MIALLTGVIAHKAPEFIILDVNGVGYRVQIPFSTYYDLPDPGGTVSLNIYTHFKEDAINLYGFRSLAEKQFFQLLISVSGIGPKLGKDILSNIQVEELTRAISQGDLARLSAIPGIGRKSAERLVVELKDKVLKVTSVSQQKGEEHFTADSPVTEDVASALVNLGYKEAIVKKTLSELDIPVGESMENILKQALKRLMK